MIEKEPNVERSRNIVPRILENLQSDSLANVLDNIFDSL